MREKLARGLALAMSFILVFTSVDLTAFAALGAGNGGRTQKITAVKELSSDVLKQKLGVGEAQDKVKLPSALSVVLEETGNRAAETTAAESTTEAESTTAETVQPGTTTHQTQSGTTQSGTDSKTQPATTHSDTTKAGETPATPEQPAQSETSAQQEQPAQNEAPAQQEPAQNEAPAQQEQPAQSESSPQSRADFVYNAAGHFADILFPAMDVHASETGSTAAPADTSQDNGSAAGTAAYTELAVTWKIDAGRSSKAEFSSETAGDKFVYVPELPEGYSLAEDVTLPEITVGIEETDKTVTDTEIKMDSPAAGNIPQKDYKDEGGQYTAEIKWSSRQASDETGSETASETATGTGSTEDAQADGAELSADDVFAANTVYTAELKIKPGSGYTLKGIGSGAFTVTDQGGKKYTAEYDADKSTVTVTFDATAKDDKAFDQSVTVDGVTIKVTADAGVFPDGATMKAERISDEAKLKEYADAAEKSADGSTSDNEISDDASDLYAFNITIYDKDGNEIEPDESKGQVNVSFSNPDPEKWDASDLSVYHVDDGAKDADKLATTADTDADTVEAAAPGFSVFLLTGAAGDLITLYTGCGEIRDPLWTKTAPYTYTASYKKLKENKVQYLPIPFSEDTLTVFTSWSISESEYDYYDPYARKYETNYSAGAHYYARWEKDFTNAPCPGDYMELNYNTSSGGIVIKGVTDSTNSWESRISTTLKDDGFKTYFSFDQNPQDVGYPVPTGEGVFSGVGNNIYIASVASFEGPLVKCTYYMWNMGDTEVKNTSIATAGEMYLGWHDKTYVSPNNKDSVGTYILSYWNEYYPEVHIYYDGANVTPVDSKYIGYSLNSHVFADRWDTMSGGLSKHGVSLGWKGITIPAHSVVTRSILIGCGYRNSNTFMLTHTFSYDSDGDGTPEHTETIASGKTTVDAPAAPVRSGYYFLGWNTKANGTGTTYAAGASVPVNGTDVTLYSMWKAIENTAVVNLTRDSAAWGGQKVQLYTGSACKYTLTETGTAGTYRSDAVLNGTYDVCVNGRRTETVMYFNATDTNLTVTKPVTCKTIRITTKLDDSDSPVSGAVTLRLQNTVHTVAYTLTGQNGVYEDYLRDTEGSYDIYVDGIDTNYDISFSDPEKSIEFYTMTVNITDSAPWENASVVLKTAAGKQAAVLHYLSTNANTATYTCVMAKDETAANILSIWVNGQDSQKTITATKDGRTADLVFYTSTVTIKGAIPSPALTMTNGIDTYSFTGSGGTYKAEHVPAVTGSDGAEKAYTLNLSNPDVINTIETKISSTSPDATLQFWTVELHNTRSDNTDYLFKTVYVCDGCLMPAYTGNNVKRNGYSFDFWSETPWTDKSGSGTPFDFTKGITKDTVLYANYTAPEVIIGDLVYTDANGNIGGNGAYYRMANLTIKGFDPGESSIKYLFLTVTNTDSIHLVNTTNMTIMNGTEAVSASGGAVDITPTTDKVAITFNSAVTMAYAQDYLRTKVIVKPKAGLLHTINVEVMDGAGEFRAANRVTGKQTDEVMTQIKSSSESQSLGKGNYYVSGNITINRYSNNCASGIYIASGATVNIYIPSGSSLTVYGGNASGTAGAGAGIYVPSNSTLYVYGSGTIYAYGGNAASGTKGGDGEPGIFRRYGKATSNWSGGGGNGGNGGGGAGAGIGGYGGNGTAGGAGAEATSTADAGGGNENNHRTLGGNGNSSYAGGYGASSGIVNIASGVKVYSNGGSNGTSAGSGSQGYTDVEKPSDDGWSMQGGGAQSYVEVKAVPAAEAAVPVVLITAVIIR
jgi:hypothetical protein